MVDAPVGERASNLAATAYWRSPVTTADLPIDARSAPDYGLIAPAE